MSNCPHCNQPLAESDWQSAACPQCGKPLPEQRSSDVVPTVDSDFSPEASGAPTIDSSIIADSGSSDAPTEPTVDSAAAPGAPLAPTSDSSLIDESGFSLGATDQTVDSSFAGGDQAQPPQSSAEETLDSATALGQDATGTAATIDSSIAPSDEGLILNTWGGAAKAGRPNMTIKSDSADAGSQSLSTLVIQKRLVGQSAKEAAAHLDYDLRRTIGKGGMGVVYSARQASLDRNVAVKMLKPNLTGNAGLRNKFFSEAVITGELDHPGIIPIYDLGSTRDGALFYSMKEVQGEPWSKAIREKSLRENLDILLRVCDAIAFSHSRDVIHRDLKPENIVVGGFGEVLVLDWGLAAYVGDDPKLQNIAKINSMGGTPAYMAPEMAKGPLDAIGKHSDVYLLGAMLYECVTGKVPRRGASTTQVLVAATKNVIEPADGEGELVDIALKAMATDPKDRYASVQAFQAAIREYQSHTESIALAARAAEELQRAEESDDYRDFSKALFGFEEAHELWSENHAAKDGIARTRLAYASSAHRKGDFDLGLSLLDAEDPDHAETWRTLRAAQHERDARQRRLKLARRGMIGLTALVVLSISVGSALVWQQKNKAVAARDDAERAQRDAEIARDAERKSAEQERLAKNEALLAQQEAEQRREEAETERTRAENERNRAETERARAESERNRAEYEAYVALIGLAAAKIDEQAFDQAKTLLESCREDLRNWEWGRLMYLCNLRDRYDPFRSQGRIEAVAVDPAAEFVAATGDDARVTVWNANTGKVSAELPLPGRGWALAFSPTAPEWVAVGCAGHEAPLRLWNHKTGRQRVFDGHTHDVLCVEFSADGTQLLSGSKDTTAKLWEVESAAALRDYRGHSWWVWDASFAPETGPNRGRIVTAGQDGIAIVWDKDSAQQLIDPQTSEPTPFRGHNGAVFTAAFSPDGQYVATAGLDQRILLWRPADLKPFDFERFVSTGASRPTPVAAEMLGHQAAVRQVEFSADGAFLASAGGDNTLKIWAAADRDVAGSRVVRATLLSTLRGHSSQVRSAVFSHGDSKQVFTGAYDRVVRRWNIAEYVEQRIVHSDEILAANFAPSGNLIVTASRDRTARTSTGAPRDTAGELREGHQFLVSGGAFYPDGSRLVTAAGDGTVRLWSNVAGNELAVLQDTGPTGAVALSPDGRFLVTATQLQNDQDERDHSRVPERVSIAIHDAASPELPNVRTLRGHVAPVTCIAVSADSKLLFTGDAVGRGNVWELDNAEADTPKFRLRFHTLKIAAAAFLDANTLLTASSDRTVCTWHLSGTEARPDQSKLLAHNAAVNSLAVTPDRRFVLTGDGDGAHLWNRETAGEVWSALQGRRVTSVAVSSDGKTALAVDSAPGALGSSVRLWQLDRRPDDPSTLLNEESQELWAAVFAPDDRSFLVLAGDGGSVWSVDGTLLRTFNPHRTVSFAAYSPKMDKVVTSGWDNTVRIWGADDGRPIRTILVNDQRGVGDLQARINSAVFSNDERWILSAGEDGLIRLFDAQSGEQVRSFVGHRSGVTFAAFMPDDRRILSASRDRTARLWDRDTGDEMRIFEAGGHSLAVLHAAASSDGTFIATAGEDMQAIVWDVATAKPLTRLQGHTGAVTAVAFSPLDGTRLLTGSDDATAKLWDVHQLFEARGRTKDAGRNERSTAEVGQLLPELTSKELLTLSGHRRGITSVMFSSDATKVLTSSRDGSAIIWPSAAWQAEPR